MLYQKIILMKFYSEFKALALIFVFINVQFNYVHAEDCALACFADISVSISTECEGAVNIVDVLQSSVGCSGDFVLTIRDTAGNVVPNPIPASYVGIPLIFEVLDVPSNNSCSGNINLENKFVFACAANVNVNIGPECETEVTVSDLLDGLCPESFDLAIVDSMGNPVPNPIPASFGGQTIFATVTERSSGNFCFSELHIIYSSGFMACEANLNVSLDLSCEALITIDDLLLSNQCPSALELSLFDGDGNPVPNPIPASYVGSTVMYEILEVTSGNICFGNIYPENKFLFACQQSVIINIGPDCAPEITVEDLLTEGMCPESFDLVIVDSSGTVVPNPIPISYAGQTLFATVTERSSGISCFTEILINYNPGPMVCLADVSFSLSTECDALITVEALLVSDHCPSALTLELFDGDGNAVPNPVPASYVGTIINYTITDALTANSCFGNIHVENKFVFTCITNLTVSMDTNCEAIIAVEDILESGMCPASFDITIEDVLGNAVPNPIPSAYVNQTVTVILTERSSGLSCFSNVVLEDKLPPTIEGANDTTLTLKDYEDGIDFVTATDACPGVVSLTCSETYTPVSCAPYSFIVHKQWTATDISGNVSITNQNITVTSNKSPSCKITGQKDCDQPFAVSVDVSDMGPIGSYAWSVDNGWTIVGSGATATVTSAGDKGTVTVVITDVNGCTTTCSKKFSCPKNKSLTLEQRTTFSILPNPASDYILIDGLSTDLYKEIIRIYDSSGKIQINQLVENLKSKESLMVPVDQLENGVYVVVIGSMSKRMVVSR